ncbi:MAG TPA: adenosine deaminase [Deltaproteobacteria bacterium]|nr:adenosine deaminase [Deltaproteobacteria bacterium]
MERLIKERRSGKERRRGYDRRKGHGRRSGSARQDSLLKGENAYGLGFHFEKDIDRRLADFIRWMPKVELHMHLEGCISPATANALIKRNRPGHHAPGPVEIVKLYKFNSLPDFVYSMQQVSNNLRTPQDVARIAKEILTPLIAQNVRYVEFDCALSKYILLGNSLKETVDAIKEVVHELEAEHDFHAKLVANIIRHHGPETARSLVEKIIDLSDDFIVGIGLSGDEKAFPASMFKEVFDLAKNAGFNCTVHAGEGAGPESVWAALRDLNADRIDHGIRSREDESLIRFLQKNHVPLTQCLTSNVQLGLVRDLNDHPFRNFYDQGLMVSLHTDDPEVFHVSLTSEYFLAGKQFRLVADDFQRLTTNAIYSSFLPHDRKAEIAFKMKEELNSLRRELLI